MKSKSSLVAIAALAFPLYFMPQDALATKTANQITGQADQETTLREQAKICRKMGYKGEFVVFNPTKKTPSIDQINQEFGIDIVTNLRSLSNHVFTITVNDTEHDCISLSLQLKSLSSLENVSPDAHLFELDPFPSPTGPVFKK